MAPAPGKYLFIGLGNRHRGDDGVGPTVAERLGQLFPGTSRSEGMEDPLALVNAWEGIPRVTLIDAAKSGSPPGTIHYFGPGGGLPADDMLGWSSHGFSLPEALEIARALGRLPRILEIYAIEGRRFDAGAGLSDAVAAAAAALVQRIAVTVAWNLPHRPAGSHSGLPGRAAKHEACEMPRQIRKG